MNPRWDSKHRQMLLDIVDNLVSYSEAVLPIECEIPSLPTTSEELKMLFVLSTIR